MCIRDRLIYNPGAIPDIKEVSSIWKKHCQNAGIESLYLIYCRTFGFDENPIKIGFRAAADFPPHNCKAPNIAKQVNVVNPFFSGTIIDSKTYVDQISYENLPYVMPGVFPSWDNTSRCGNTAKIFINTSPELFKKWIQKSIHHLKKEFSPEERFLFINAWNEWGEGAHLEPDRKYGYAYLHALRNCLNEEYDR